MSRSLQNRAAGPLTRLSGLPARLGGALLALALLSAGCTATRPAGTTAHSAPLPTLGSASGSLIPSPPRSSAARPAPTPTAAANPGGLTDAQLVGQLFVSYVYGSTATTATPAQRQANLALYGVATGAEVVRRWHLGGIILIDHNNLDPTRAELSTGNVDGPGQITTLTAGLQHAAVADSGVRLLIGTDQEGGSVQRITNGVDWRPSERQLAQVDPATLRCSYRALGTQLRTLGVNQDYAPVADVVRASGGVIGDRSFGPDPNQDARDVVAAVAGLQDAGVLATLKHWPGHGSTPVDSHEALPVLTETAAQWLSEDRPPFQAASATAAAVMVGHLAVPALDPSGQPATLSPLLIGTQLRRGLGFRGLVMTDSLWMAPMLQAGTPGQVAIRALRAGEDMLLETPDLPGSYRAVLATLRSDPGFRSQLQTAAEHILAAKARTFARTTAPAC